MQLTTARSAPVKPLPAQPEDRMLAARLAQGEPAAFDQLVECYGRRVVCLASRLLGWAQGAEDVAQEVFLTMLRKPTQFRGEAQLWTYLAAITVNRCRSLRRRRWLHERVLAVVALAAGQKSVSRQPVSEQREMAQAIRQAVARLPRAYREVIVLRYFEEMSIEDVGRSLGLKPNAVEVRLSRARKLLEASLGDLVD
jgi:RNA polymerase sigma-70 factor, ECF subfamily